MNGMTVISDSMDPARIAALAATIGVDLPEGVVPPFAHHLYFWQPEPRGRLGRDGHPAPGIHLPDTGLPRRMWAGGRLEFHVPLRTGRPAERRTRPGSVVRKTGRTGPLAFVTLVHEVVQDGTLCLREEQDIVYREDGAPAAPAQPVDPTRPEAHPTDSTLLFRYSALTFNGHRIHYDDAYARKVEGYAGLVVHGPLLAQLLALRAERTLVGMKRFAFTARSPVIVGDTVETCAEQDGAGLRLWVRKGDGTLAMQATAH